MKKEKPQIGIGVIVNRDNTILMGKRKNTHGNGTWSFPGGYLEFGESIEDGAQREVAEEAGLKVKNLRLGPYTNDVFEKEERHYVTLFVIADYAGGEPKVREPDKVEEWRWFNPGRLPEPLFLPVYNLVRLQYRHIVSYQ